MVESLLARLGDLQHWEIAFIATYLLCQGMIVSIFPEEIIITTLGLLWSQDRIGFLEALVAVWAGLLPANATTVFLGSRYGPRILPLRPFCWMFKKEAVEESLRKIRHYGNWIVFVTRFTPMIRGPIYFAAGLSQFKIRSFVKVDAIASCFQVPALLLLGSVIGKNANSLMEAYQKIGIFMASLIMGVFVFRFYLMKKKGKPSDEVAHPSIRF